MVEILATTYRTSCEEGNMNEKCPSTWATQMAIDYCQTSWREKGGGSSTEEASDENDGWKGTSKIQWRYIIIKIIDYDQLTSVAPGPTWPAIGRKTIPFCCYLCRTSLLLCTCSGTTIGRPYHEYEMLSAQTKRETAWRRKQWHCVTPCTKQILFRPLVGNRLQCTGRVEMLDGAVVVYTVSKSKHTYTHKTTHDWIWLIMKSR